MGPRFAALIALLLVAGCVSPGPVGGSCAAGDAMIETQLFFGLAKPRGGFVSAREWEAFVAQEIAPRYPEGFTVFDGGGHWRDQASGRTISEKSKVVLRLQAPGEAAEKNTADIIRTYKARFQQDSVLRTDRPVCATF